MILLDTHVLVWMDADASDLGSATRQLIEQAWAVGEVAVSAVSFWECALLHTRGRITLPTPPAIWRAELLETGLLEYDLDGETAILSTELDLPHPDPADRFIAACAIRQSATLVTADGRLLDWSHALNRRNARE